MLQWLHNSTPDFGSEQNMLIRRSPFYTLKTISGIPYLLPFGQMISDRGHGIQINDTGCYLWQILEKERTVDEITALCAGHYHASPDEIPHLKKDLDSFLEQMITHGILTRGILETSFAAPLQAFPDKYLKIGGLNIQFCAPAEAFPKPLLPFLSNTVPEPAAVHQHINLHIGSPKHHANGRVLVRNEELTVMEDDNGYILLFPASMQILEARLLKDASKVIIYCNPPYSDALNEQLMGALRLVYLLLAQNHHMVALHSASILYHSKAWLFSAPSGTGKSTHANLWHSQLDVPVLNGDLNLLAFENQKPVIHGIPWCGTSRISDVKTHPLGGIILLKQAKEDFVEDLSPDKSRLLVLQRLISPSWNPDMQEKNLQFVEKLAEHILICRLHCTKNPSAVRAIKNKMDGFL